MQISILGSYGEGNLGDEAILAGILTHFPNDEVVIFTHNSEYTAKLYPDAIVRPMLPAGFRSYFKQAINGDLKKSLKLLKESERILIGGGGIFYDSKFSVGRNPIKVWYWRIRLLNRVRAKFELYAVGISKLEKKVSQKLMRKICFLADKIFVRDEGSFKNLLDIGVKQEIAVIQDPAFDFPTHGEKEIYKNFTIGISLRAWEKQEEFFKKALEKTEGLACLHTNTLINIKLIPMSTRTDDDRKVLREFKDTLPKSLRKRTELTEPQTPIEAYKIIAGLDFLIGMRLHSLIFAQLAGIEYLPLVYDEKVKEVLR